MRPHFGKMLRRWRPRFGLRALLIVLTLGCIWLACVVGRWHREKEALRLIERQQSFIAAIAHFDGSADMISEPAALPLFATVTGFHYVAHQVKFDETLERLRNVRSVTFSGGPPSSADFRHMANLQRRFPHVSINYMAHLSGGSLLLKESIQQYEAARAEFEAAVAKARQTDAQTDLSQ